MHQRSPCAYRATLTPEPEGGFTVTFPDVPEAITYGADEREAMEMASEVLELAIVARMEQGEDLPPQQSGASDDLLVPLRPLLGAKAALYDALSRGKVSKSELARRLGVDEAIVRRMLDPARATRVDSLAAALAALGQRPSIFRSDRLPRRRLIPGTGHGWQANPESRSPPLLQSSVSAVPRVPDLDAYKMIRKSFGAAG